MDGVDPRLSDINDCLYRVAAKAIIVHDHKILTVKDNGDAHWGLPGGGIDYGEEVKSALCRELLEEICVGMEDILTIEGPVLISTDGIVNGVPRINICYKIEVRFGAVARGSDVDDIHWQTADELADLPMSPSITEHKTELTAFLK